MGLRYASVCSGIEAATVAWHELGFEPVWFSQYDPEWNYDKYGPDFASRVLQHHYPSVPNLGDMTKLRDNQIYKDEKFDLLVGGTPCQAFSIAGLRQGLDDDRSNLALEYVRILKDKQPQWFVWENVPGVLNSNGGADFASIISGFTGQPVTRQKFTRWGSCLGRTATDYSISYRILDSRYFGVPQRRRRVFVVGHIGTDWRPPVAVLLERDSLRRDFTPGKDKRKGTAEDTEGRTVRDSGRGGRKIAWPADTAACLDTNFGTKQGLENQHINGGGQYVRADDKGTWWDGSEQAATLTRRSSGQYMPDKGNFEAVIQKI